jgi:hypothetical protein
MELKDKYKVLLDTRNLEISLFWQRSNYFLVLNTAIAVGMFGARDFYEHFAVAFAVAGLVVSCLWFWVCLGGKYWQSRWEYRLSKFERENFAELKFFGATSDEVAADAKEGLSFHPGIGPLRRWIYGIAHKHRPSVSFSMILLSLFFIVAWLLFVITFVVQGVPFVDLNQADFSGNSFGRHSAVA